MPPSPPGEGFCAQSAPTDAKAGRSPTPKSFPLRGRCRRRRRKRCRTGSLYVSTDAEAQRKSPLPSSGLRETPDATLPSRGGIFSRSPFRRMQKRNVVHLHVLPLEGKVSPQATEEVSYRKAASFDGRKSATKITSSVIRLAGDAGCHPPLKGRDLCVSLVPASCGTVDHRPPGCLPFGGTAAGGLAAQRRREG